MRKRGHWLAVTVAVAVAVAVAIGVIGVIGSATVSVAQAPTAETTPPVAADGPLAPLDGPATPKVVPLEGDDGIYHPAWFEPSFLDLADDAREAEARGKRFAVIFEQRGCIYCKRLHTEVLAQKWINDWVRDNFYIVQLDLWGAREVTDLDGTRLPEKRLAERWGVMFTPTIVFFKDGLAGTRAWGPPVEVTRMQGAFGAPTVIDMFAWVRARIYERDRNFQRFHVARMEQRAAIGK